MAVSMADITKLRKMTGAGMMDCKNALTEAEGDFDKAMEIIRKKGQAVAAKRSERDASEGCVLAKTTGDYAVVIALKCETDFVAKNAKFQAYVADVAAQALTTSAKDMDGLKNLVTMLGDALNCEDRAKQVTDWYDETMDYFNSKADEVAALSEDEMPRVLHFQNVHEMTCYTGGINTYITTLEGGQNFTLPEDITEPSMETILEYDPEIIFISNFDDVTPEDFYENKLEGQDWSNVSAVKNHKVYKVPCGLYRWAPPNTFEKPLYMKWTASIVQPEIFSDYDIRTEISDFYKDYYGYELSDEQLDSLLRLDLNK